jgi:hypothetical protein
MVVHNLNELARIDLHQYLISNLTVARVTNKALGGGIQNFYTVRFLLLRAATALSCSLDLMHLPRCW